MDVCQADCWQGRQAVTALSSHIRYYSYTAASDANCHCAVDYLQRHGTKVTHIAYLSKHILFRMSNLHCVYGYTNKKLCCSPCESMSRQNKRCLLDAIGADKTHANMFAICCYVELCMLLHVV